MVNSMAKLLQPLEDELGAKGFRRWHAAQMQRSDWKRFWSPFRLTLKTFRESGQVKPRVLHTAKGHPYAGVSKMINNILSEITQKPARLHASIRTQC